MAEKLELTYPCRWEYTVIGEECSLLKDAIDAACSPLTAEINHSHSSSKGKYHSLKAILEVPDEATRLRIFRALKKSAAVKIVL